MAIQDPNDILSAITTLGANVVPVAQATIPSLNFTVPTDLDAKYKEFLDRAAKDPDIINYYKQLLDYAKGDTDLAKAQIEKDYQVGVRQTTDTLGATLKSLGLTFGQEQDAKANTLNQRGIALTDIGGGKTAYAAGGQPATELGQLNESQKLRQEAEKRTAQQGIEKAGISREKGLTTAGAGLRNTALDLKAKEGQDIYNRANVNFGAFQASEAAKANQALIDQQKKMSSGGGSSGSTPDKGAINPSTGKAYAVNPSSGVWDDNYFAQTYG